MHLTHPGHIFFSLEVLKSAIDCGTPHSIVHGSLKGFSLSDPRRLLQKYLQKDNNAHFGYEMFRTWRKGFPTVLSVQLRE